MPLVPPVYIPIRNERRSWVGLLVMGATFAGLGGLIALDVWWNAPPQMPNEIPILDAMVGVFALGLILIVAASLVKRADSNPKSELRVKGR